MQVPEWICSTICAGIDIDGLNDGSSVEDPDEMVKPLNTQNNNMDNPLFAHEEGNHI